MDDALKALFDAVDSKLSDQAATISTQQREILALNARVAALTPPPAEAYVVRQSIQKTQPEVLWYEARSPGSPQSGPHGSITFTLGEPTTADFRPIVIQAPDRSHPSDNVYLLYRLYPKLTDAERARLEAASRFSVGCEVSLDPLSVVQAFELDYQIRKSNGTLINVGLQLRPDGTLRAFDYVGKQWVALGPRAPLQTAQTISLRVDAGCDGKLVQFSSVTVNSESTPVVYSHPVSQDRAGAPYFNVAYQLDGRADAKPYKATVGRLTATFA